MNAHKTCVYQLNQNYPRPPHGRVYLLLGALSVEVLLAFTVGLAVLCGALPYTAAVATTVATVVGGALWVVMALDCRKRGLWISVIAECTGRAASKPPHTRPKSSTNQPQRESITEAHCYVG